MNSHSTFDIRHSTLAIIALGSNLGDSASLLRGAMARLQQCSHHPLLKSSLWQTAPVDCPPGSPPFVNAVVALRPRAEETPESLFEKLQALEQEFGRRPGSIRNAPRPLDLDLIAFGQETRATPHLTLPHPRAHHRRFVLQPLSQIAPDFVFAGPGQTVSALLDALPADECVRRLD